MSGCSALPARAPVQPLPAEALSKPERFVVVTVRNTPLASAARAASTVRGYDTAGSYTPAARARITVRALAHDYGLSEVSGWPIEVLKVHCVVYRLAPDQTADSMVLRLTHDPRVESVQPLQSYGTFTTSYNDPYRSLQRNLDRMSVEEAHRSSTGKGVTVAVIDTGADIEHPDLQAPGRRILHRDFVGSDPSRFNADRHGTQVAGLIGAVANNGIGIAGVAPEVALYVFKACWYPPQDAHAVCNTFTLGQALAAAIDLNIQVVNLSLSGPIDPLLGRLVSQAIARGAIVVGAIGDAASESSFPSAVPGVIAVDTAEDHSTKPGVVLAPGREILTLAPGGHYDFASGSSLATAEVSGTVALLLGVRPGAKAREIRALLLDTAESSPPAASVGRSINACAAVAAAGSSRCAPRSLATAPATAPSIGVPGHSENSPYAQPAGGGSPNALAASPQSRL